MSNSSNKTQFSVSIKPGNSNCQKSIFNAVGPDGSGQAVLVGADVDVAKMLVKVARL